MCTVLSLCVHVQLCDLVCATCVCMCEYCVLMHMRAHATTSPLGYTEQTTSGSIEESRDRAGRVGAGAVGKEPGVR